MLNATIETQSLLKIVERLKTDSDKSDSRVVGSVNAKRYTQLSTVKTCACGCSETFTTSNIRQKYVDNAHRQRAYRKRKQAAHIAKCGYCGAGISHKKNTAKYCNDSHRRMAHRQRKNDLIMSLVNRGVSIDTVLDACDMHGISALRHAASLI